MGADGSSAVLRQMSSNAPTQWDSDNCEFLIAAAPLSPRPRTDDMAGRAGHLASDQVSAYPSSRAGRHQTEVDGVRARVWVSKAGKARAMQVIEETVGDVRVLCPAGRIDHASVTAFQDALLPRLDDCRDGGIAIVLDLSKVEYMSSVGLRVLMLAAKQCKIQKGDIVVAALGAQMRENFQISRFDMVFPVYDDRAAAVSALARTVA